MTLNIVQGDDFSCYLYLKDNDGWAVKSATFYVVSGNPYLFALESTDDPNIGELKIPSDVTNNMFVGKFRSYTRIEYENTIVKIDTNIDNIQVLYKYNKTN